MPTFNHDLLTGSAKPILVLAVVLVFGGAIVVLSIAFLSDPDDQDTDPSGTSASMTGDVLVEGEKVEPFQEKGRIEQQPRERIGGEEPLTRLDCLRQPETVCGFILDPEGNPISGAQVAAIRQWIIGRIPEEDGKTISTTQTGDDGWYVFRNLPAGKYSVFAEKEGEAGFGKALVRDLKIRLPELNPECNILMKPCGSIQGRVIRPDGHPASGASVSPAEPHIDIDVNAPLPIGATPARTDEAGVFSLHGLPQGGYTLVVSAPGLSTRIIEKVVTGTSDLTVRLRESGSISGRVTIGGEPASSVLVMAHGKASKDDVYLLSSAYERDSEQIVPKTTRTGKDGRYYIGCLAEGLYQVRVVSVLPSCSASKETNVQAGERNKGVDLALQPHGSMEGCVVDAGTDEPLEGVWLMACPDGFWHSETHRWYARTGPDGRYLFKSIPAGKYVVGIKHAKDYVNEVREERNKVTVKPGEKTGSIDFRLEKGAAFHLTVHWEGSDPLDVARLFFYSTDIGDFSNYQYDYNLKAEVEAEGDGRFRAHGLKPGNYSVHAYSEGWIPAGAGFEIVSGREPEDLTLTLEPAIDQSGKVVDPEGIGVPDAWVTISSYQSGRSYEAFTDSAGVFRLRGAIPGIDEYTIEIRSPGYLVFSDYKEIRIGGNEDGPVFTVTPEGVSFLAGIIRDDQGRPVGGAEVICSQESGQSELEKTAKTSQDGRFRLTGLQPVKTILLVKSTVGVARSGRVAVLPNDTAIEIVLDRFASVKGRFVNSDGRPVDAFSAYVLTERGESPLPEDGDFSWTEEMEASLFDETHITESRSFSNGVFDFSRQVAPGIAVVHVEAANGYRIESEPFEIGPAALRDDLVFTLPKMGSLKGKVVDAVTGKPVAGATIFADESIYLDNRFLFHEPKNRTTSNDDGTFVFHNLEPAEIDVAVEHPDYSPTKIDDVKIKLSTTTEGIVIHLAKGGAVEGRVLIHGENKANIEVDVSGFGNMANRSKLTDCNGFFRFENLTPGEYLVSASLDKAEDSSIFFSEQVRVEAGETTQCNLESGNCTLEGQVTVAGSPRKSILIFLLPGDGDGFLADTGYSSWGSATTQDDGCYRIEGLHPGQYRIEVGTQDRFDIDYEPEQGELEINITKTVTLQPGITIMDFSAGEQGLCRISGQVFENNLPKSEFWVQVTGGWPNHFEIKTKCDKEGFYKFENVPAGSVYLVAGPDEWFTVDNLTVRHFLDLKGGDSIVQDIYIVTGSSVIWGRVTKDGELVEDRVFVDIARLSDSGDTVQSQSIELRDGAYRAENLAPGRYEVGIAEPRVIKKIVVLGNDQEIQADFDIPTGTCSIEGAVVIPGTEFQVVYLFQAGTCPWEKDTVLGTDTAPDGLIAYSLSRTDDTGQYAFQELLPGEYDLVTFKHESGTIVALEKKRVILKKGETKTVDLDCAP